MISRFLKPPTRPCGWQGRRQQNILANSVVTLSVKYGSAARREEQRTVIFEPNRNLEHTGVILPVTLSTFNRSTCELQLISMSDDDIFLVEGTEMGTITDTSVYFSRHFKIVGSHKVHISKYPSNKKRVNECPLELTQFIVRYNACCAILNFKCISFSIYNVSVVV